MPVLAKAYRGGVEIQKAYFGATLVLNRTVPAAPPLADVRAITEVKGLFVADPAYLYTDAGSTHVASDGDAVQEWHCANGTGEALALIGGGVTYGTDGTRHWIEGNGSGRLQSRRPNSWKPDMLMAASGRATTADFTRLFSYALFEENNKEVTLQIETDGMTGVYSRTSWNAGDEGWSGLAETSQGTDYVVAARLEGNSAYGRVNGVEYAGTGVLYNGKDDDDRLAVLGIGKEKPHNNAGRVYAAIVTDAVPSAADLTIIEQWLAARAGVR